MNVRVQIAGSLGPAELARWAALQRASPLYRSPFFHPEFTLAVARVRPARVAVIEHGGSLTGFFPFEVGRGRTGRPVGRPFSDYHGVVADDAVAIDARELVRACGLTTWSFDHVPAAMTAFAPYASAQARSPRVDLGDGFEPYLATARTRSDVRNALRHARRLEREVGPLELVADSDAGDLLAQALLWKRRQYAATGVRDVLADPRSRALLQDLHAADGIDFAGMLSVLLAGDQVAALHFGLRSGPVLHYWFPAYNPDLGRYSPGLVLILELARAAPELGIAEIDLGKGDSRFKRALATDAVALHEGVVGAGAVSTFAARAHESGRRLLRSAGMHRAVRRAARALHRAETAD